MKSALICLLAIMAACGGKSTRNLPPALQEREDYREAMRQLLKNNTQEATEAFSSLLEKASNPEVGELATLRLGDTLFAEGKYAEAREIYREFVEQFGSSPNVPYALYMSARCHWERAPGTLFIMPPAEERNQTDVDQSITLLRRLLLSYPASFAAARGKVLFARVLKRSCDNDLYVAGFYRKRDRPRGTMQRLEQILIREADLEKLGLLPPGWCFCRRPHYGFSLLAEAYYNMKDRPGLEKTLKRYRTRYPKGEAMEKIQGRLSRMKPTSP